MCSNYKCKVLMVLLLVPFILTAQPAGWQTTPTLFTHVLTIPASVTPTIYGNPISTGDWIGVFYNDGGNLECGGYVQYVAGVPNAFSAFGDDPLTPDKDGFSIGESFIWRINYGGIDYWCNATLTPPTTFTIFGFSEVTTLYGPAFSVAADATPNLFCGSGGSVTLNGTLLAGGPVLSWTWYDNGNVVGTGQTITTTVSQTTTFRLEAYDGLLTAIAYVTVTVQNLNAGSGAFLCGEPGMSIPLAPVVPGSYLTLLWTTSGTGTFDNAFIPNATYYPSSADINNGSVDLTLTVVTFDCGSMNSTVTFTFQPAPSIDILPDQDYVCYGDNYDFTGKVVASNYDQIQWFTTNGGGYYIPNETVLEPTYVPSPTIDWPQLCVILGVSASAIDPCVVSAEDFMTLCFVAPPEAFAGASTSLCASNAVSYTFSDANVSFDPNWGGQILWTTTGDGTFDDPTIENPTYTFGPNDLALGGLIEFTLTATTPQACPPAISTTSIYIQLDPSINIIPDSYTICEGEDMNFAGLVQAANYSQIQWFTTNGGGFFNNETLLEPIYTPSPTVDYPQGCITIGVAAVAIDPCTVSAEDFMQLCFQMLPVVVAGTDATVCSRELYTTNPTVQNSNGPYLWTVTPAAAGTFTNPGALVTTFKPNPAYAGQTVVLTLTAWPIGPCADPQSGSMNLYIEYSPYVNAGPDMTICSSESATINGECAYVSMTMWATTGDGYFVCPDFSCAQVQYYPGPGDIAAGCVTLVLIGYPNPPCTMFVLDKMKLCFDPAPVASAGPDMTICEGDVAQLNGSASNYCGIQWITLDGTGTFSNENILNPVYTPSFQDVISGTVHLTMLVAGCGACNYALQPTMALTIQRLPQVDAGQYDIFCDNSSVSLSPSVLYASSVLWTTQGDGTFDNPTFDKATYTPGPTDKLNQEVTLCITAYPVNPCVVSAEDCVTIPIQPSPSINIIPPSATICYGDNFDFTGLVEASNYSAIQWFTTNGAGIYIPNETVLEPTYIPSPTIDWPQGCIVLGVVASPIDPCQVASEDFMDLCFQAPPTVDAGPDATICENASYTLNPTIQNGGTVLWTTSGDGTFDNPALPNATYTPGPNDIVNGYTVLTITVQGLSTCEPASDYLTIYYQPLPTVNAGPDQTVCERLCMPPWTNTKVQLNGSATNQCGYLWTTSGDGTFNNPLLPNAIYTLGNGDIAAGSVVLTLTALPCNPCVTTVTDQMVITIQKFPDANAGPDQTICEGETAQLNGSATNYSGVFWDYALLGEGDGTFSNKFILNPVYTPGPGDIALGYVELIMVAFPISPCTYPDADIMTLYITKQPVVNAGPDATICYGESYTLSGASAQYYQSVIWTADPADFGQFSDPNIVNPTFTPYPGKTGYVTLTLEAIDGPECGLYEFKDSMTLFVNDEPQISFGFNGIEAGPDASFEYCFGTQITVTLFGVYGGTPPFEVTYTINGGAPVTVSGLVAGSAIIGPQVFAPGVYNIDITAIKDANNCYATDAFLANLNFTVTVWEEVTLTCPSNITVSNDPGLCGAEVSFEATVSGEPLPITVTYWIGGVQITSPYFFPVGTTTVDVIAENICATLNCSFNVTVNDTELPTITCVDDQARFTDPGFCYYTVIGTEFDPTVGDNCSGPLTVSNNINGQASLAGYQFAPGTYNVVWTVTDVAGNSASCDFDLVVTDNELPTIVCPANVTVTADPGVCYASNVDLGTPLVDDNCGVASVVNDAPATFPVGTTIVTWTVTDVNGNSASCEQTVTVTDDELPTIVCPDDVTVTADPGVCYASNVDLGTPTVNDNCGVASVVNDAPATFPVGTTIVTWTVTDVNGNSASCEQTVTVTDDELPTIVCPANVTVTADPGVCYASNVDLGTPLVDDNCGVASVVNDAPATFPVGNTTVTWTVTDVNGNSASCQQTVTVIDNELPTIVCPANVTVTADPGVCYASNVDLGTPIVNDNCGVASVVNDAPATFPVGTTIVTWTVTDVNGNSASCQQTVTVTDDELPTIVCPANVTVYTDPGVCYASNVALGTPTVNDNCGVASVVNNAPSTFPVGITIVTWTVTDVNGNSASCEQTVTVIDNELPTIICPPNITVSNDPDYCGAYVYNLGTPVVDDNCGVASVTNNGILFYPVGTTVVTWTVTDVNGNSNTCQQLVTVNDAQAPVITLLGAAYIEICQGDVYVDAGATAYDNCDGDITANIVVNNPVNVNVPGTYVITYNVTDAAGNAAIEVTRTVVVVSQPIPFAGNDTTICETGVYVTATATVQYATGIFWETSGDGFFDDDVVLLTTYYPGAGDIAAGSVELCLTAYPIDPCTLPVTDCMILYFDPAPTAFAGTNALICEGDNFPLTQATASNYSTLQWIGGDGTFTPSANVLNPTYVPGPNDIANGGAQLCLLAYGTGACAGEYAASCFYLTIVPVPTIQIDPVIDLSCDNYDFVNREFLPIPVCATVNNAVSVQWSTSGDGTFVDPTSPCTFYNLGTNDRWAQSITLTLQAFGPGACGFVAVANVVVNIPTQIILIDQPTWWGISSYVNKSTTPVPTVMYPAVLYPGSDALVIMLNKAGQYYWPEPTPPVNQLGNWQPIGYKAKFKKNTCIPIYGNVLTDHSFVVGGPQMFTYVPVLTNVVTDINTLFAGNTQHILLIYDWNEAKLWTEFAQDFTQLIPGKAYLLVRKPGSPTYTVNFPPFDPNAGIIAKSGMKSVTSFSSPWNEVINTAQTHFILFADQVLNKLQSGDIIGAFNADGQCVGVGEFTSKESLMKLIAMGDDPLTSEVEGFAIGETMTFKLYRQSTGETFDVTFTYDTEYPNYDNTFEVNGVSRVTGMTMSATAVGNVTSDLNVNVFPNPAKDVLNIVSEKELKSISLVNYVGQTVYSIPASGNTHQLNVSTLASGMYFVRIENVDGAVVTKRVTIK